MIQQSLTSRIIVFFLILFVSINLSAQSYVETTLTTQEEVNEFGAQNLTEYFGLLKINGENITDLSPLSSLKKFRGVLYFYQSPNLLSLNGLHNLDTLEATIAIDNTSLENIDALSNISHIKAQDLAILGNKQLTNLTGLKNISSVEFQLIIVENIELENIDGLSNVKDCSPRIIINDNPVLKSVDGLIGLTVVDELQISGNALLTNIKGSSNIQKIMGGLYLSNNPILASLDGLHNLTTVEPTLDIHNNSNITNLDPLENLESIYGSIQITSNKNLSKFCGLYPVLTKGIVEDYIRIENNLSNPTPEEIISAGPCDAKIISYKITLPNCEESGTPILVEEGTIMEDSELVFPSFTLPSEYAVFQQYYNALKGTRFGIPYNSLKENIEININLEDFCSAEFGDNPNTQDLIELFFLSVTIIGEESGEHNPLEYYYFENDNEAYIRIPLENLEPLRVILDFDLNSLVPFFTQNGLNPDFEGIRKEIDDTYFNIYTKHFSEVRLGINKSVTDISRISELVSDYKLEQNYPNPFNPSTRISYSIKNAGQTSLVIYNSLGQAVKTLVNENQQAGSYAIDFNASELTSGIYFYTLTSGGFTQTNKMILMK